MGHAVANQRSRDQLGPYLRASVPSTSACAYALGGVGRFWRERQNRAFLFQVQLMILLLQKTFSLEPIGTASCTAVHLLISALKGKTGHNPGDEVKHPTPDKDHIRRQFELGHSPS